MALLVAIHVCAQIPSPALLVLEKSDNTLAIVDTASLQIVARVAAGQDPHEVVASQDGKLAYISNYGGEGSTLNTISVVDLMERKALRPIDLGALHSPHGLAFVGGELYFTAETSKAIGRYDPATQRIDWVLGTGQDRTHMIVVANNLAQIVTSNVSSVLGPPPGAISPQVSPPPGAGVGPRKTWAVTNVRAGKGSEGFDLSPNGMEIWVANAQDGTITIIDAASKTVRQTMPISVTGANRLKFTPDGRQVLVSGLGARGASAASSAGDLAVLDAATRKEVKMLKLRGGSAGILVAPDGGRAYVAVSATGNIAVVDLKTLEVIHEISAGNRPDGLAWAVRN
jgi:YVTN family beta-propeller protein